MTVEPFTDGTLMKNGEADAVDRSVFEKRRRRLGISSSAASVRANGIVP
jgi:hypothetical protein